MKEQPAPVPGVRRVAVDGAVVRDLDERAILGVHDADVPVATLLPDAVGHVAVVRRPARRVGLVEEPARDERAGVRDAPIGEYVGDVQVLRTAVVRREHHPPSVRGDVRIERAEARRPPRSPALEPARALLAGAELVCDVDPAEDDRAVGREARRPDPAVADHELALVLTPRGDVSARVPDDGHAVDARGRVGVVAPVEKLPAVARPCVVRYPPRVLGGLSGERDLHARQRVSVPVGDRMAAACSPYSRRSVSMNDGYISSNVRPVARRMDRFIA